MGQLEKVNEPILMKSNLPTYIRDKTGEIKRCDEREIVFARKDLFRYFGEDSSEYKVYYETHPEHLEFDVKIGDLRELGTTGGIDLPMSGAQFDTI